VPEASAGAGDGADARQRSDYRVNYHGTNVLVPRRMNVLIDGVSVYQPLFARVDWTSLPIVIDDIDRIEVTRGSNSAAYGPNSLLAIINIISRHPRDVSGPMPRWNEAPTALRRPPSDSGPQSAMPT
jgi:outer membrane cobalamin receptor